jgi:RNA polymerase sigma-70 factor (ECF subfamily)
MRYLSVIAAPATACHAPRHVNKPAPAPRRAIVFCILPEDLAAEFHEPLRAHFAGDPSIEVVVEQRWRARRDAEDRRSSDEAEAARAAERRRIRAAEGRRAGDRRVLAVHADPPESLPALPAQVRDRLVFVRRLEPSSELLEDRDTARLIGRLQAGERGVFEVLYMRYFERVFTYLQMVYKSQHQAEDAAQHVFMQVFEQIHNYERRAQPFRAWLFRIVRNHAVSDLRRSGRLSVVEPDEVDRSRDEPVNEQYDEKVLGWLTDRELLLFIERLPLAQRQVLMLRYMLDLSNPEIALVLERSEDDVRQLHSRALAFLRSRLAAMGRTSERGGRHQMTGAHVYLPVLASRKSALNR